MQAHISNGVVMDIAAFKVSHGAGPDLDATALPAEKTSARNVPSGRWNVTRVGSIRRKTHEALPRHTANSEHTIGAMEEMSGQGQKVSTHISHR